jgi:hypothetical protein
VHGQQLVLVSVGCHYTLLQFQLTSLGGDEWEFQLWALLRALWQSAADTTHTRSWRLQ